jgi:iron complex transport system permease protein
MTLTSEAVPDAPSRAHPVGDRGYVPFLLATAVVLATVSTVAVWSGAASLSFADVFAVLYAHVGGPPVDPLLDRIVWGLRVPRILIAALAGAGLSLAGAVLQALVRNPIADPYILGVGSGASFGAVLIMTTGIGTGLSIGVPVAAFLGAMVSLIAVLVLGRREGMLVPLRMVLAGVAIGYLLSAATSFVQLRADPSQLSGVLFWLLGSVSGAGWSDLGVPAAVITVCAAVLLTQSRQLNALAMGDESAQSVGVDVRRTRLLLLVIASLLTVVGLVGPNGSGKSSLLRALYRSMKPRSGIVKVDEVNVWDDLSPRSAARIIGVVGQEHSSDFSFSVREVVATGRTPHHSAFSRLGEIDRDIVSAALARTGMHGFGSRLFAELSGGEKQRVMLARAIAQQPSVLVLDEPTNHLDIRAQLELMELVAELGTTTIVAIHELALAAAYCDYVCLLSGGVVVATGPTAEVLTEDLLSEVFGVQVHLGTHPLTGRPLLSFAPPLLHTKEAVS